MRSAIPRLASLLSATACGFVEERKGAPRGLDPGDCVHASRAYAADPEADGPRRVGFHSFAYTHAPVAGEPRTITVDSGPPTELDGTFTPGLLGGGPMISGIVDLVNHDAVGDQIRRPVPGILDRLADLEPAPHGSRQALGVAMTCSAVPVFSLYPCVSAAKESPRCRTV